MPFTQESVRRRLTNYPSDLSADEWLTIRPLLPRVMVNSKNRKIHLRNVLDAISYWARHDVSIHNLPDDFPRPGTVHFFVFRWAHDGTLSLIMRALGDKHPMTKGLHEKVRSLKWIGTPLEEVKRHNQYHDFKPSTGKPVSNSVVTISGTPPA